MLLKKFILIFFCCGFYSFLISCAAVPTDPAARREYEATNDPFEPLNRKIFAFNMTLDEYVLEPAARGYRFITPKIVRTGVSNVLSNLSEPLTFVNNLLQFEFQKSIETLGRFVTNSLLGIGGIFDVASNIGVPSHKTNFSETFAVWGFGEGPYLVIPFIGSANVRTTFGMAASFFDDPLYYVAKNNDLEIWYYVKEGVQVVADREAGLDIIDSYKKDSLDFYATVRTIFQQNQRKLTEGDTSQENTTPSYEFDFPAGDEEFDAE